MATTTAPGAQGRDEESGTGVEPSPYRRVDNAPRSTPMAQNALPSEVEAQILASNGAFPRLLVLLHNTLVAVREGLEQVGEGKTGALPSVGAPDSRPRLGVAETGAGGAEDSPAVRRLLKLYFSVAQMDEVTRGDRGDKLQLPAYGGEAEAEDEPGGASEADEDTAMLEFDQELTPVPDPWEWGSGGPVIDMADADSVDSAAAHVTGTVDANGSKRRRSSRLGGTAMEVEEEGEDAEAEGDGEAEARGQTKRRRQAPAGRRTRSSYEVTRSLKHIFFALYSNFFSAMGERLQRTRERIADLSRGQTVQILRNLNTWYVQSEDQTSALPMEVGAGVGAGIEIERIQPSDVNGAAPAVIRTEYLRRWREYMAKQPTRTPLDEEILFGFRVLAFLGNVERQLEIRFATAAIGGADPAALNLTYMQTTPVRTQFRELDRPTRATLAHAGNRYRWLHGLYEGLRELEQFVGLRKIKDTIANYLLAQVYLPTLDAEDYSNFAFFGNPGTGKTEVALKLAGILYYNGTALRQADSSLALTTRNDFVAPFEGQTAPMTNNRFLNTAVGSVMVIDEAYSLVTNDRDSSGTEALAELVKLMSQFKGLSTTVITGYEANIRAQLYATNVGMPRRFPFNMYFEDYTAGELVQIGRRMLQGRLGRSIRFSEEAAAEFGHLVVRVVGFGARPAPLSAWNVFAKTNAGGMRNFIISLARYAITKSVGRATILALDEVLEAQVAPLQARGVRFAVTVEDVRQTMYAFVYEQLSVAERRGFTYDALV